MRKGEGRALCKWLALLLEHSVGMRVKVKKMTSEVMAGLGGNLSSSVAILRPRRSQVKVEPLVTHL
jgi:hypothetical protein